MENIKVLLTKIDEVSLKVLVLQHHDPLALLQRWVCPSVHLTALDIIPGIQTQKSRGPD